VEVDRIKRCTRHAAKDMYYLRDKSGAFGAQQCAMLTITKHNSNKKLKESRLLFGLNTSIIYINQSQCLNNESYGGLQRYSNRLDTVNSNTFLNI